MNFLTRKGESVKWHRLKIHVRIEARLSKPKDVDQTSEKKENKTHLFNDYIKQMQFKYKWNDSARARVKFVSKCFKIVLFFIKYVKKILDYSLTHDVPPKVEQITEIQHTF